MPKKTAPKDELPPQPEISIGLVGHVDHGKTTLTERLSANGPIRILKKSSAELQ